MESGRLTLGARLLVLEPADVIVAGNFLMTTRATSRPGRTGVADALLLLIQINAISV